jgi:hypothetical protein
MFVHGKTYPNTPEEEEWIRLHVSEAALREIALAIGTRYWSPDKSYQARAAGHMSQSLKAIIGRIQSGTANTEAVIGAVLTFAIQERLLNDEKAWTIHINGLTNIVHSVKAGGSQELPQILYDFLIL